MMPVYPTQYSTLSSAALNETLQQRYGLTGTTCRLLMRNVSDTYLLENAADKYIFKIYRDAHRKVDEIKAEVELLSFLKAGDAKVAYPLTDIDGGQLQAFNAAEGTRYGVLFSYAHGKVVHNLSPDQLSLIGREMARIHNISSKVQLQHPRHEFNISTTLIEPLQTVKPAFVNLPDEYAYLTGAVHQVAAKIEAFDLAKFSYGYCHYDFLPKNFHINDNGGITFFDLDFCGHGLLANDLASFYVHFFLEVSFGKITQEKADTDFAIFVEAYRAERAITDEELAAIPYLGFAFWIFYLGFQYENFDDWSSVFFNERFLRDRTALIKRWADWYCKL